VSSEPYPQGPDTPPHGMTTLETIRAAIGESMFLDGIKPVALPISMCHALMAWREIASGAQPAIFTEGFNVPAEMLFRLNLARGRVAVDGVKLRLVGVQ